MESACLAKYVDLYRAKGCNISMISIQNEPAATQIWDSCIYTGGEEGAFAPILRGALDAAGCADASNFAIMSEYYYIGHFSRYIQPDAVCLGASVYAPSVEATAFQNPDGSRAAVVLNATGSAQPLSLTENGSNGFNFTLEPHSIATVCW